MMRDFKVLRAMLLHLAFEIALEKNNHKSQGVKFGERGCHPRLKTYKGVRTILTKPRIIETGFIFKCLLKMCTQ